jgi:hypothetical protein
MIALQVAASPRLRKQNIKNGTAFASGLLQHTPKLPVAPDWALRSIS